MSDLIERLLAVDGGDEGTHWYRNPEGPEAAARIAELEAEVARKNEALANVVGCFDAAEAEGLIERMNEDDDEPGSLAGLIRRRLSFAKGYAIAALAAPDTGGVGGEQPSESPPHPIGILAGEPRFDWPHDDRYYSRCRCGVQFVGPKRAPACWRCAGDETRNWWRGQFAAPDTGGAGDEWACRGGTRVHCHVFCTCDGSKAEEIDPRL